MVTIVKPTVGASRNAWGPVLDAALDALNAGKAETVHSHSAFGRSTDGFVPAPGGSGTTRYLREDGAWGTPAGGGGGGVGTYQGFIDVVGEYGAAGDALPITGSITAGSASFTISGSSFPSSGVVGKTVVIKGAGPGGVPHVATITARNSSTNVTLSANAATTVSGASAYWGTNDTTAIITARDAWINGAVAYTGGNNGDRVLQKSLYFRPGKYIVTSQNALMSSPTSGTAAVLRNGLIHGGQGTEGAEIIFASTVSAATVADKSQGNLITAANRLHGFKIDNLKLRSLNANQTFAYLWCSVTNDGGQFPGFGSGSQRRIQWTNLDFKGDWQWGIALDGDTAANLNSEQYLANIYISDTTTFSVAFFHSGVTDPATNAQQDQFVNYIIENCILEYANGSAFKFDRGGHITCIGGSFVGGVGGSGTVKFFDFSRGGGNYWKCHLAVIGTRFEMRTATSRVLYSEWRDQIAHVSFENCAMSANAVPGTTEETTPFIEIVNTSTTSVGHGSYRFVNCEIPGYIRFSGSSTQSFGRIVFDQCNFTHSKSAAISTEAAGTGYIQYAGSYAPKYRFRDCWNITDAAN